MADQKLTPWFPSTIKPVRTGVYQQQAGAGAVVGYRRWDGNVWFCWHVTPENASKSRIVSSFQDDRWRGLTEPSGGLS